ncbi:hypothetical protein AWB74_06262 [Caballeronia arvi]|uniref:Uncharacterized protein n=1 Tax=Caballeronia arvi TaxID=1777135 RepID=A0A158KP88_9BURK|nr:hypothetical protein AWB74_06262 [Caballeronia arvi]
MSELTTALGLRAAINVLRDLAESRKMQSGESLGGAEFTCTSTLQMCSRRPWKIFVATMLVESMRVEVAIAYLKAFGVIYARPTRLR